MRGIHKYISLTILTVLACIATARASGLRVALVSQAEVHGDSIYISDLLPAGAPDRVREEAQKILVGAAPEPGSARLISGTTIAGILNLGSTLGNVDIPQQITIRRSGRLISREEIIDVIRPVLNRYGFPEAARELAPEDIRLSARVMVSEADAKLELRSMDFDPLLKQIRFLFVSRVEKNPLPFMATAQLRSDVSSFIASHQLAPGHVIAPGDLGNELHTTGSSPASGSRTNDLPERQSLGNFSPGAPANLAQLRAVSLVTPRPATLDLASDTMQMFLNVNPLERGALGQKIRVKLSGTGKILQGQVTGFGRLEAKF